LPHIATFRCAASARCGAFADERRVVAGEGGGRVRRRKAHLAPERRGSNSKLPSIPLIMSSHVGRRSSTRVRVPARVVRRGRSGMKRWWALRFARLALEPMTSSSPPACTRHPPSRRARALRRVRR
jgi:hypothetical protein